jgi:TRAP-type C4-dicarboxylate transport system permease small subunit
MSKGKVRISHICDTYINWLSAVCSGLMLLIVLSAFLQVFCRKVLNNPLTWTEEFSRLAFIWMNCLGSAIVVKEKKHISFSMLTNRILKERGQKVLSILIDAFLIAFSIFLLSPTFKLVTRTNSVPSAAMQIPSGIFYLSFAVGSIFMLGAYCIDILGILGKIPMEDLKDVN